jgi:hypothetical protein
MLCRVMMKEQKMKVSYYTLYVGGLCSSYKYLQYLFDNKVPLLFTMKFPVWYFFGTNITSPTYRNCCFLASWLHIDRRNVLLLECYVIVSSLSTVDNHYLQINIMHCSQETRLCMSWVLLFFCYCKLTFVF